MKIIFSTGNSGKLREASEILGEGFELVTPASLGLTEDIPETGNTLRANSLIKAQYIYDRLDANIEKLLREMALMENECSMAREYGIDTIKATRKAVFKTVITLILNGEKHFFEGVMEGKIAIERAGDGGFGYDSVFIPDELPAEENGIIIPDAPARPNVEKLTAAQISEEQKNAISHRGKALRSMAEFLKSIKSRQGA